MGRSKRQTRPRSPASFRREAGKQSPRKSILIVCEGKETEPRYFEALRNKLKLTLVEVEVEGKGGAPITVVNHAIQRRDQREREAKAAQKQDSYWGKATFDQVWCVFDVENLFDNSSFYEAVNKTQAHYVFLAVSNPSFEYWYLLHFKETTQPFANAAAVTNALKKYVPGYTHSLIIFDQIYEKTNDAVKCAKRVLANRPDEADQFPNPSTGVCHLVEIMQAMSLPAILHTRQE